MVAIYAVDGQLVRLLVDERMRAALPGKLERARWTGPPDGLRGIHRGGVCRRVRMARKAVLLQ